jgi:hypothetical protein
MHERQLTSEAEAERCEFEREYSSRGCTCFISPPCNFCLHPGNPLNQEEDDTAWEPEDPNAAMIARDERQAPAREVVLATPRAPTSPLLTVAPIPRTGFSLWGVEHQKERTE